MVKILLKIMSIFFAKRIKIAPTVFFLGHVKRTDHSEHATLPSVDSPGPNIAVHRVGPFNSHDPVSLLFVSYIPMNGILLIL